MSDRFVAKCPHCGDVIELDESYEVGDEVICHGCDAELRIKSVDPIKFKNITSAGMDDDDDDESEILKDDDDGFGTMNDEDEQ